MDSELGRPIDTGINQGSPGPPHAARLRRAEAGETGLGDSGYTVWVDLRGTAAWPGPTGRRSPRLAGVPLVASALLALAATTPGPARASDQGSVEHRAGRHHRAEARHPQQGACGVAWRRAPAEVAPPVRRQDGVRHTSAASRYPLAAGHVGAPGCGATRPDAILLEID